jgi:dTDP-4-amino-4,6-dideoxygalactose transaminase
MPFGNRLGDTESSHHLAVATLRSADVRDRVRTRLADRGIQTSLHYPPIHLFSAYRNGRVRRLPRTEEAASRLVTLPLFAHMRDDQVTAVVDAIVAAV